MAKHAVDTVAITPYSKPMQGTIFIGANCLPGDIEKRNRMAYANMINPYASNDDVAKATEYCWDVSSKYCDELGEALNGIHGLSYDKSYWRAILLPWAVAIVENVYDRYLRLKYVKDNYPDAVIEIPNLEDHGILYNRSFDVWRYAHLHNPNIRIYYYLIDKLGLSARRKHIDANIGDRPDVLPRRGIAQRLKGFYRSLNLHFGNALFLWHSEKPYSLFGLAMKMGFFQWGSPALKENKFIKERLNRDRLTLRHTDDEFENILRDMTKMILPTSLYEEYRDRRDLAISVIKSKNLKTLFMEENFWTCDMDRILTAEVKAQGGKIIGMQHGGGYGANFNCVPERVERSVYDYYITWGWIDNENCRTIPLPSPYLSALTGALVQENNDIFYIGTQGPQYMFRYHGYWMPEYVETVYYGLKKDFLNALSEPVKKRLLYKTYPYEYGWNERARVKQMVPRMRFYESGRAVDGIRKSSLVIIDHPSTSFLEAFRINVPTVLFWDDARCRMREDAKPYFQLLVSAGILYYDPIAAAKKVNEIAEEPKTWWLSSGTQKAVCEFCCRFALANKDWKKVWHRKLLDFGVI